MCTRNDSSPWFIRIYLGYSSRIAAFGWCPFSSTTACSRSDHRAHTIRSSVVTSLAGYVADDLHLRKTQGLGVKAANVMGVGGFNPILGNLADFSTSVVHLAERSNFCATQYQTTCGWRRGSWRRSGSFRAVHKMRAKS